MNLAELSAVEMEKELIGNLINQPDCYAEIHGEITAEDFWSPKLGKLFETIGIMYEDGTPIDMTTLAMRTKIRGDEIAGFVEMGWFSANAKYKARVIKAFAHKRRVSKSLQEVLMQVKEMEPEAISTRLSDIAAGISIQDEKKKVFDSREMCKRILETQERRLEDPGTVRGISTGYEILDRNIRGLRPKRITLIAAGTGFGKSTLALNLLANVTRNGAKPLLISTENDVDDNLDRLCGVISGTDMHEIELGRKYAEVCGPMMKFLQEHPVFISDNSPRNIDEVVALIGRYVLQEKIDIVFVDYIGEISGEAKDKETEEMKLARFAQKILDCSKRMNIHIVVLAQLNRQGNKGRPSKTDLAGCFRIAQKAHSVILFWQDECDKGKFDIITIDKNRQGPNGVDIAVTFERNTQRIRERGIYLAASHAILDP